MIRAVVDTNVLVSSLLSPNGNEALLVLAIENGMVMPCLMETILDEYTEVLTRRKFKFKPDRISSLLTVLQCAYAASADFLATGNKRHFPASPYGSTYVVSARELLSQITLDIAHFS